MINLGPDKPSVLEKFVFFTLIVCFSSGLHNLTMSTFNRHSGEQAAHLFAENDSIDTEHANGSR